MTMVKELNASRAGIHKTQTIQDIYQVKDILIVAAESYAILACIYI